MLIGGYFPERDEPTIESEEKAWELATAFASKTLGRYVDIYVTDADFIPVKSYRDRIIRNRY